MAGIGETLRSIMYEEIINQGIEVSDRLTSLENQVALQLEKIYCSKINKIYITGCGDSYYVGTAVQMAFWKYAGIAAIVEEAFEFNSYNKMYLVPDDLLIAISVSGQVGTTLRTIEEAKKIGCRTLGLNATPGSKIWSEADGVIDIGIKVPSVGPVPQTCHYLANIVALYLLAIQLGLKNGKINRMEYEDIKNDIMFNLGHIKSSAEGLCNSVKDLADKVYSASPYVIVGSGPNLATARFSAAKLREAACMGNIVQETEEWAHEERLMTKAGVYTFIIAAAGNGFERSLKILEMIKSFHSSSIAITDKRSSHLVNADVIWEVEMAENELLSPMCLKVPMELFAYYISERLEVCPFNFEDIQINKTVQAAIYADSKGALDVLIKETV